MTLFYKIFDDFPHVPEEFISRAYDKIGGELSTLPQDKPIKYHWDTIKQEILTVDGVEKVNASNMGYNLDDEIVDWVHKNIINKDITNIRISISNSTPEKDTNGAHCDLSRNYTLIYLLDNGGEDHETLFYQEQDKPLVRNNGERCPDHSKLKIVERIKIPLRTWIVLNARILHGVINIPNPRISIQVGLNSVSGLNLDDQL
jgi:hypothetical protein